MGARTAFYLVKLYGACGLEMAGTLLMEIKLSSGNSKMGLRSIYDRIGPLQKRTHADRYIHCIILYVIEITYLYSELM